jgi:hypothetical protein
MTHIFLIAAGVIAAVVVAVSFVDLGFSPPWPLMSLAHCAATANRERITAITTTTHPLPAGAVTAEKFEVDHLGCCRRFFTGTRRGTDTGPT